MGFGSSRRLAPSVGASLRTLRLPRFLGDLTAIATASYLATAAQFARGVLIARLLPPLEMGAVAAIGLILSWAQYCDLGAAQAAARELSLGTDGHAASRREVEWSGMVVRLVGTAVLSIGLLILAWAKQADLGRATTVGLVLCSGTVLLQAVLLTLQGYAAATKRFRETSILIVTLGIANLCTGVAGAWLWGTDGVFFGQVVGFGMTAAVAVWMVGMSGPVVVRRASVRRLLSVGVLLAALSLAGYNLINIDQIMTLWLLGREPLGVYVIVLYVGAAAYLLPTAVASTMGPRLLGAYGRSDGHIASIARETWRPVYVLSVAMALIVIALWVFVPWLVAELLPRYTGSIAPMRVYLAGLYFLGVNLGVSTVLSATGRMRTSLLIIVGVVVLNVLCDLVFVGLLKMGLMGIAIGSVVTYVTYYFVHLSYVAWMFVRRVRSAVTRVVVIALPGVCIGACVALSAATIGLESPLNMVEVVGGVVLTGAVLAVFGHRLRERPQWTP